MDNLLEATLVEKGGDVPDAHFILLLERERGLDPAKGMDLQVSVNRVVSSWVNCGQKTYPKSLIVQSFEREVCFSRRKV